MSRLTWSAVDEPARMFMHAFALIFVGLTAYLAALIGVDLMLTSFLALFMTTEHADAIGNLFIAVTLVSTVASAFYTLIRRSLNE